MIGLLDLLFADRHVENPGRFGISSRVVVVVGNETGVSPDSGVLVPCGVGLLGGWGVRLRDDASNGGGDWRN